MDQKVNLLEAINLQALPILNDVIMMRIVIAWIVLLIVIYGVAWNVSSRQHKAIAGLAITKKDVDAKMATYVKNNGGKLGKNSSPLGENGLPLASISNTRGFYDKLLTLSEIVPSGVWLDKISMSQENNSFIFKGHATSSIMIPVFIKAIDNATCFDNNKFGMLKIEEDGSDNMSFELGTVYESAVSKA